MSEFKGTPAPWKLANGQQDMVVTDRSLGEGQIVAATYGDNMPENAMLIAAAPDLLEELQLTLGSLEEICAMLNISRPESTIRRARAAIAKALGDI